MADGLSRLLTQHIALARLELAEDARSFGKQAARLLAFAPLIGLGYALCCIALGVYLGRFVGLAGGLACVGGLHLLVGAWGTYRAVSRFRGRSLLDDSARELGRTAEIFSGVAEPSREVAYGHERTARQDTKQPR
jgi:hypothetical protein